MAENNFSEENEEIVEETEASSEEVQETEETKEPDELAIAEEKAKAAEEKYLRLFAEFDNYKKRTQREKDSRYADAVIDTVG